MTISLGTASIVDASATRTEDIAELSSTLAIVAYSEGADVKARTVTIAEPPTVNAEATVENTSLTNTVRDEIVLAPMTSTSAMIIYKHGNTGTMKARVLTVSGTTVTANAATTLSQTARTSPTSVSACKITSTSVMLCYARGATTLGTAVVLSVSGTTITENTTESFDAIGASSTKCIVFSSTKALATYIYPITVRPYGNIIDISGTTLSANTAAQIENISIADENEQTSLTRISATKAVFSGTRTTNFTANWVLTLNGATFDIGTRADTTGVATVGVVAGTAISDTSFIASVRNTSTDLTVSQIDITGVGLDELTVIGTDTLTLSTITYVKSTPAGSNTIIIHYLGSSSSVVLASVSSALTLVPMTKPADIDAAGEYIYLALLEGGTPIITKIDTDLSTDGTTVFNPGAGDNIGVECGRFNSDVVWVAGQFDGTNVIEKSEDGGATFSVADDGTIGGIKSFVMGPDNDNRILVFDEDNGDILETNDGGTTWTNINASVTPEVNAIARLGKNVQETVFGNDGGVSNSINYSINSGDDLEDYQTGVYPNANATRVIVN